MVLPINMDKTKDTHVETKSQNEIQPGLDNSVLRQRVKFEHECVTLNKCYLFFLTLLMLLFLNISARLFPSCRVTLGIMGLLGGIIINVMRNNLGVGIVCMTTNPVNNDNNTNGSSTYHRSMISILFPNYIRSRQQSFLNDEFEDCPSDVSSGEGYGEVGLISTVLFFYCEIKDVHVLSKSKGFTCGLRFIIHNLLLTATSQVGPEYPERFQLSQTLLIQRSKLKVNYCY